MQPFNTEIEKGLRGYIAHLRAAHKTAEMLVAQETVRLNSMQAYREAIIPLLARIRRHVFQDSRLNGYQIEGWEDEHGQSLLGTEADILVRGGIHNIGTPTLSQPALASSSLQSVPTLIRPSLDSNSAEDEVEGIMNTRSRERRGFGRVPDIDDSECTMDHHRPNQVNGGRAFLTAGKAPLSTLAPNNVLGSEVLIQVDCERQTKHKAKKEKIRMRSRSRSRHDSEAAVDTNIDGRQAQGANDLSALGLIGMNNSSDNNSRNSNNRAQEDREGQKRMSRGLFGFVRSRRNSGNESEDVVVPTLSIPTVLQFDCNSRSTVDVTSSNTHGTGTMGVNDVPSQQQQQQRGHRRNVPSISVSNHDTAPGSRINQDNQHPLGRSILENGPLIQLPFWSTPASGSGSSSSLQPSTPFSSSRSSPSLSSSMIRPQMMSVDEYVGVGPIIERIDGLMGPEPIDLARSGPLIPSYEEHHRHQAIDPGSLQIMQTSVTYEGLSSLAEQGEGLDNLEELIGPDSGPRRSTTAHQHPANRIRSRSLSPHSFPMIQTISTNATGSSRISGISSSNDNNSINNTNVNTTSRINSTDNAARPWYQHHHYSFSDQSPDDRAGPILNMPPPDYAVQPPRYTA
ncbi:hypothetical protein BCR41DRAFT_346471 [Lobosporangium transversale]|uniref:Uncharacterized protein n=1 Tax=Lobosporangium transversale TaxID=64571 RepID=A0A1Y2GY00_9FUNG|nr:hypothetical protein BCR41DRAFT_346471 [Lobosporangium transversale]ORZ27188.1 hypothetical protein BCR41DRAFT_346471 [Lobosporangium transversale]|eukprot:XP_021884915.1 hypothetical protein BCR41DRAFT_346471 [Lobosporangium transversale]